jgi:hypothetical protein
VKVCPFIAALAPDWISIAAFLHSKTAPRQHEVTLQAQRNLRGNFRRWYFEQIFAPLSSSAAFTAAFKVACDSAAAVLVYAIKHTSHAVWKFLMARPILLFHSLFINNNGRRETDVA